eukprot:6850432-Pyramimonas_sp.AAC.1
MAPPAAVPDPSAEPASPAHPKHDSGYSSSSSSSSSSDGRSESSGAAADSDDEDDDEGPVWPEDIMGQRCFFEENPAKGSMGLRVHCCNPAHGSCGRYRSV